METTATAMRPGSTGQTALPECVKAALKKEKKGKQLPSCLTEDDSKNPEKKCIFPIVYHHIKALLLLKMSASS